MENSNIDVVKRGYEAFGRGDVPALLGLFDKDIEWVTPGPPELPTSGIRRGPEAVGEFFRTLIEHFEVQQFVPREFIAQGDRVVVTGDEVARLRSTGKVIEVRWAHVFGLKNGLIVSFHEYFDTCAAVEALREASAAARV
jgi:ketosteroid isomerase-like protein